MKTRLAFLFCSIALPCFAGFIYAYNVDGDPTCIQVGDTCALDNPTETFWDRSTYANPRFAWITESTYDECVAAINAMADELTAELGDACPDDVWADLAASMLLDADPDVAAEVCRCQLGFVPDALVAAPLVARWAHPAGRRRAS